jgi:hypothetical protein
MVCYRIVMLQVERTAQSKDGNTNPNWGVGYESGNTLKLFLTAADGAPYNEYVVRAVSLFLFVISCVLLLW